VSREARDALGGAWFKAVSRGRKAALLAQALLEVDCDAATARTMADFNWDSAAQVAGVNRPSHETKAVAVGIMDAHEQAQDPAG
jgi:hypothetical protein